MKRVAKGAALFVARVLVFLWQSPVAVPIWACYLLPFWALGWHWRVDWGLGVATFVVSPSAPGWLLGLWSRWGGHAMPHAVVLSPDTTPGSPHVAHEVQHTVQWAFMGTMFPVIYLVLLLIYGYQNHPLERDANRAAGIVNL